MKKVFLIVLITTAFISCKKESLNNQFAGKWEYERFSGYPFNDTSLPPGNGKIINLTSNGTFERYAHDTLLFKGNYTIKKGKDCSGNALFFTTNDPNFSGQSTIEINNAKLILSTSACISDGGSTIYRKAE